MSKKGARRGSSVELFTATLGEHQKKLEELVRITNPPVPEDPALQGTESLVTLNQSPSVRETETQDLWTMTTPSQPQPQYKDEDEGEEEDEQQALLTTRPRKPITPSLTAKSKSKSRQDLDEPASQPEIRHFEQPLLTEDQMEKYDKLFENQDPYELLATIIRHQNTIAASNLERKHVNLQNRLASILSAVQFCVAGAREEYRQAVEAALPDAELQIIKQKMETFEEVHGMLTSLRSLSKNRSRYTAEHLDSRLKKLPVQSDELDSALREVIEPNLFNKRKFYQGDRMGSTPFDSTQKSSENLGKIKKRVKIEHKNNGQEVSAMFSYSRRSLLRRSKVTPWKTPSSEFAALHSQIKDLVNVAVSEYNKGTQAKPINIKYIPSNIPQPDAALMLLMEYKKRAILEGRTFYALHEGKHIKITPSADFSKDERDYFMKYALEKPQFKKGNDLEVTKGCAGYKIFKLGGVEMEKTDDRAQIQEGMDKYLALELGKLGVKLEGKLDRTADELTALAQTDGWQKDSSGAKKAEIKM